MFNRVGAPVSKPQPAAQVEPKAAPTPAAQRMFARLGSAPKAVASPTPAPTQTETVPVNEEDLPSFLRDGAPAVPGTDDPIRMGRKPYTRR